MKTMKIGMPGLSEPITIELVPEELDVETLPFKVQSRTPAISVYLKPGGEAPVMMSVKDRIMDVSEGWLCVYTSPRLGKWWVKFSDVKLVKS